MNLKYNILAGLTFLSTNTQTLNGQNIAHEYNEISSHFCNLINTNSRYSDRIISNAYNYAYKALQYSTSPIDSNNAYINLGRATASSNYNTKQQNPEIKQAISNLSNAQTESDSLNAYHDLGMAYNKNQEQLNNNIHPYLYIMKKDNKGKQTNFRQVYEYNISDNSNYRQSTQRNYNKIPKKTDNCYFKFDFINTTSLVCLIVFCIYLIYFIRKQQKHSPNETTTPHHINMKHLTKLINSIKNKQLFPPNSH